MMTNIKLNAITNQQPKDKQLLLDFLDEKRFDVEHTGNKSTRDKNLIKLINSPAIRAGSLKESKPKGCSTKFLSSNPNELCDRMKLILQENQALNNSNIMKEEVVIIADKFLEYKCIPT